MANIKEKLKELFNSIGMVAVAFGMMFAAAALIFLVTKIFHTATH